MRTLDGHKLGVCSIAFSPDRTKAGTAGLDGDIYIWNIESKDPNAWNILAKLSAEDDAIWWRPTAVRSIAFSPDSSMLGTAGENELVMLWNITSPDADDWAHVQTLEGHTGGVNSIAFSPNGKMVGTAGKDGKAIIWSVESDAPTRWVKLKALDAHYEGLTSIAFSSDGSSVGTASEDGEAKIWSMAHDDPANWTELMTLDGHKGVVYSIAFMPNAKSNRARSAPCCEHGEERDEPAVSETERRRRRTHHNVNRTRNRREPPQMGVSFTT